MYLEICLITALLAIMTRVALPHLQASLAPPPSPARHRRDRYSVEAIRTRIERETHALPNRRPARRVA